MIRLLIALVIIPLLQFDVLAPCDDLRASGFCITTAPPSAEFLPFNTAVTVDIQRGTATQLQPAIISGYLIWRQPVRPPEYVLSWDGGMTWVILPRSGFRVP